MEYAKKINRVIDFITSNIDSPLPIEKLATIAGLSEYHFHRVFRSEVGETVARYIARLRLEKAGRQLLRNEDMLIAEIAANAGFSSPSLFCRNFKRHFGMTPQEYKNKNSKQNSKNNQSDSTNNKPSCTYTHYPDRKTAIGCFSGS